MRAGEFLAAAEALPFADLGEIVGGGGLVVVAPHPDDESLGCGGLIAEACARGVGVRLVVLSDGIGSHPNSPTYPPARLRDLRERETLEAVAALGLGAEHVRFLRLPDRFVPTAGADADAAVDAIVRTARDCQAGAMVVTWAFDPHCDHAAAAAIASCAVGRLPAVRLYAYPVWGWALPADTVVDGPPAGFRLDIARHLDAKMRAVAAHRSQTTGLIGDDPGGFRLDAATLARFERPFEMFLEVRR